MSMSETPTRVVVREIPAPADDAPPIRPPSSPGLSLLTVLVLVTGFALYFGTLLTTPTILVMSIAINLIVLGIILGVGAALARHAAVMTSQPRPATTVDIIHGLIPSEPAREHDQISHSIMQ